jgi:hypothetical protein
VPARSNNESVVPERSEPIPIITHADETILDLFYPSKIRLKNIPSI